VARARHPIVCQIDQDVRLLSGWMRGVLTELDDEEVGAAQGWYATDPEGSICSRVMGLDLEQRYAAIAGDTDHVCTGNTAYRVDALRRVGLFDEAMGYGYDNDMSYRLRAAGFRLRLCRGARALHGWRDGLAGYVVQQYGLGYGRVDVVAKHKRRVTGDRVSPLPMMLHPVVTLLAVATLGACRVAAASGLPVGWPIAIAAALLGALALERLTAGGRAARRFGDRAAWLFPLLHLVRDLAWVAAIVVWLARRAARRPGRPSHSMRPRLARIP
jgi:succinoglycan biosynthesis protein ExoA